MLRNTTLLFVACILALPLIVSRAQDAATSQPATQPASEVIDVGNAEALTAAVGKEVSVRGKISDAFKPQSGSVLLLNFEGIERRSFTAVVKKENFEALDAGFDGDVGAAVKGKTVIITGTISLYRDKPQIEIATPEQIKVQADPPTE